MNMECLRLHDHDSWMFINDDCVIADDVDIYNDHDEAMVMEMG